jgi:exonuclease SbcC
VELRTQLGVVNAQLKDYQQQQLNWANSCSRCSSRFRPSPVAGARPQDDKARSTWLDSQLRRLGEEISQDEKRQGALLALQKDAARLTQQLQAASEAQQQAQRHLDQQHQALAADQQQLEQGLNDLAGVLPQEFSRPCATTRPCLPRPRPADCPAPPATGPAQGRTGRTTSPPAQLDKLRDQQQARSTISSNCCRKSPHWTNSASRPRRPSASCSASRPAPKPGSSIWKPAGTGSRRRRRHRPAPAGLRTQGVQLASELKANSQRQQALEHECQQLQGAIAQWRSSHPELDDAGLDRLLAIDDAQLMSCANVAGGGKSHRARPRAAAGTRAAPAATCRQPWRTAGRSLEQSLAELQQQLVTQEQQCAELRATGRRSAPPAGHQALAGRSNRPSSGNAGHA